MASCCRPGTAVSHFVEKVVSGAVPAGQAPKPIELNDYLMENTIPPGDQDTARPFIMENDSLWRDIKMFRRRRIENIAASAAGEYENSRGYCAASLFQREESFRSSVDVFLQIQIGNDGLCAVQSYTGLCWSTRAGEPDVVSVLMQWGAGSCDDDLVRRDKRPIHVVRYHEGGHAGLFSRCAGSHPACSFGREGVERAKRLVEQQHLGPADAARAREARWHMPPES